MSQAVGDQERLILLNLIPEVGSTCLRRLLDAFGDLDRLWCAGESQLARVEGISAASARRIAAARQDEARLEQELALAQRHGIAIVTLGDAGYPKALRSISDPPLALYVKGTLLPGDETAVSVVGARRASLYGLQCAERLGYDLALRGVTVVSGLARGIDAAAHRGALRAKGRSLAVLGSGLLRVYPVEHGSLAEEIAARGAVLSEYPLEAPPLAQHFPRRNRLISGLSLGVVVVEAAQRSGALITADCALEQGREVFAVPGPVTSATSHGTHQLLKQGARLAASVEDIVEELRLSVQPATDTEAAVERTESGESPDPSTPVSASLEAACPSSGSGLVTSEPRARSAASRNGGASREVAPKGRPEAGAADPSARPGSLDDRSQAQSEDWPGGLRLPEAQQRVLACVERCQPRDIDAIAAHSGVTIHDVSSALLELELKRLIRQLPGKRFMRR